MKITGLQTHLVRLPGAPTLADIPDKADQYTFVTLQLRTDEGIEGIGITFFGAALAATLKSAVDQLGALTVGEDPLRPEAVVEKLRGAAKGAGPGGIFTLACTAIDIALWDIKGKALGLPVWKLLGGFRDRVPTYASGAMTRDLTLDEVVGAGPKLVAKGFQPDEDAARASRQDDGREGSGAHAPRARKHRSRHRSHVRHQPALERPAGDIDRTAGGGSRALLARGRDGLRRFPGARSRGGRARYAGRRGRVLYGPVPFRHMMEARSVDIVMVDLMRAGGITQWMKIAGMAEAFNLPIVSHLVPEIHVHLVAAVPNGLTVEYMPRSRGLYKETPKIEDGHAGRAAKARARARIRSRGSEALPACGLVSEVAIAGANEVWPNRAEVGRQTQQVALLLFGLHYRRGESLQSLPNSANSKSKRLWCPFRGRSESWRRDVNPGARARWR